MNAQILSQGLILLGAAVMLLGAGREFWSNRKATGLMLTGMAVMLCAAAALR